MCGNFGLVVIGGDVAPAPMDPDHTEHSDHEIISRRRRSVHDDLDRSVNESIHTVSMLDGIRTQDADLEGMLNEELVSPVKILEAQTACTEIRGGQAGGYSSIEYDYREVTHQSRFDAMFEASRIIVPKMIRIRSVARKRHPLAADLTEQYLHARHNKLPDRAKTITVIGHTRFATSSVNIVKELHPHEWVPAHEETIWSFNSQNGKFERYPHTSVGLHITHNGDFDEWEAYSQTMVIDEIGHWLERILHRKSTAAGDSPKIAGCMDLLRVQGRWAAAARLAWVRAVLRAPTDVSDGEPLETKAPSTFPTQDFWDSWEKLFERAWKKHMNNIVKQQRASAAGITPRGKQYCYCIDRRGTKKLVESIVAELTGSWNETSTGSADSQGGGRGRGRGGKGGSAGAGTADTERPTQRLSSNQRTALIFAQEMGVDSWSTAQSTAFVHHTVRGFLYGDLYTALTEFVSRTGKTGGSFGLQAHCTLEPGVVVIGSKGQPMAFSYNPSHPIVLFASESEALAVPVYKSGKWLPERIDLDSGGEVVRIGVERALKEGTFRPPKAALPSYGAAFPTLSPRSNANQLSNAQQQQQQQGGLLLSSGIEIRSYSLVTSTEATAQELAARSVPITSAPLPYDPKKDLVAADLAITPAVLCAIDRAWANPASVESVAGKDLAQHLVDNMRRRQRHNLDTTDLLIGGIEASLWLGEQFAADLRRIFPLLNVVTLSTNKWMGLGDENANKVFFPGSDEVLPRRIDTHTCVLLISQSGQTFPTLHATRKMANYVKNRLWILTGCFHSKMEQALIESYKPSSGYKRNRVFNNYSGHRPAEPTSVAVAATWHTLTRMLLQIVHSCRVACPGGRILHPWEYEDCAIKIQKFFCIWHRSRALPMHHDPQFHTAWSQEDRRAFFAKYQYIHTPRTGNCIEGEGGGEGEWDGGAEMVVGGGVLGRSRSSSSGDSGASIGLDLQSSSASSEDISSSSDGRQQGRGRSKAGDTGELSRDDKLGLRTIRAPVVSNPSTGEAALILGLTLPQGDSDLSLTDALTSATAAQNNNKNKKKTSKGGDDNHGLPPPIPPNQRSNSANAGIGAQNAPALPLLQKALSSRGNGARTKAKLERQSSAKPYRINTIDFDISNHDTETPSEQQHQHRQQSFEQETRSAGNLAASAPLPISDPTCVTNSAHSAVVSKTAQTRAHGAHKHHHHTPSRRRHKMVMRLSDGCILDIHALLSESFLPNICHIVGHDVKGKPLGSLCPHNPQRYLLEDNAEESNVSDKFSISKHSGSFSAAGSPNAGGGPRQQRLRSGSGVGLTMNSIHEECTYEGTTHDAFVPRRITAGNAAATTTRPDLESGGGHIRGQNSGYSAVRGRDLESGAAGSRVLPKDAAAAYRRDSPRSRSRSRSGSGGGNASVVRTGGGEEEHVGHRHALVSSRAKMSPPSRSHGWLLRARGIAPPAPPSLALHAELVHAGHIWADHITESWTVLIGVGIYLLLSVSLGLSIISLLGDAVLAALRAGGLSDMLGEGHHLSFSLRYPSSFLTQPIGYTVIGFLLQVGDALFFIYLGKNLTRLLRLATGRPLGARMGKRTIVIVDNPTVHQLLENFVSKLFSQSYSIVSVDVHGASGLDHFVHRFTHRVTRGLLLAVGRPDGRLCCLAKSEASTLLAAKQAAFIRNPAYNSEGNGPEILTLGHNPFQPNLSLARHVVLDRTAHSHSHPDADTHAHEEGTEAYHVEENGECARCLGGKAVMLPHEKTGHSCIKGRRKFVDEYLYERLFLAHGTPFSTSILRALRRSADHQAQALGGTSAGSLFQLKPTLLSIISTLSFAKGSSFTRLSTAFSSTSAAGNNNNSAGWEKNGNYGGEGLGQQWEDPLSASMHSLSHFLPLIFQTSVHSPSPDISAHSNTTAPTPALSLTKAVAYPHYPSDAASFKQGSPGQGGTGGGAGKSRTLKAVTTGTSGAAGTAGAAAASVSFGGVSYAGTVSKSKTKCGAQPRASTLLTEREQREEWAVNEHTRGQLGPGAADVGAVAAAKSRARANVARVAAVASELEALPLGVHHIHPSILHRAGAENIEGSVFADFVFANKDHILNCRRKMLKAASAAKGTAASAASVHSSAHSAPSPPSLSSSRPAAATTAVAAGTTSPTRNARMSGMSGLSWKSKDKSGGGSGLPELSSHSLGGNNNISRHSQLSHSQHHQQGQSQRQALSGKERELQRKREKEIESFEAAMQHRQEQSNDPAVRLAFSLKLDGQTRQVQDLQVGVQQFYECRVASLERYLAFCVAFHAMAAKCAAPPLLAPWDIARSQSNLRVATTASPISAPPSIGGTAGEEGSGSGAAGGGAAEAGAEESAQPVARKLAASLRKFSVHF